MFELPEAKRVRREDLNESDDSAWDGSDDEGGDADLRAKLNAQIARSLGLVDTSTQSHDGLAGPAQSKDLPSAEATGDAETQNAQEGEDEDMGNEEEFAFRLFSTAQPTQKVVLEEEVEPQGEGGFVVPNRPLSHYVVKTLTGQQRAEYDFAAVTGDEILQRSETRSWGFEMPWKVTTITVTRKAGSGDASQEAKDATRKRRPNKKQRIMLRKKVKAKEEKKKAAAEKAQEKEEHIKDKKKRMNRLKKLRRRAKNKEQKEGANDDGAGSGDESD